ncbi:MAG: EamA family transporter RarD [Nevskiaceae bacterium]|jgi:chloramphenicol-sensitive protein RarD|nr:EamA family transporter RarD [Nevskiaceae bacterium]
MTMNRSVVAGTWYAALAFLIWGLFPLYWIRLATVPAMQLVSHRVVWCTVAAWLWLLVRGELGFVRTLSPRGLVLMTLSSLLIGLNWSVYVIAATTGHVVDTSLGYYITPLVNILFAVFALKESLNVPQRFAVGLAGLGVVWLAWQFGAPPWVALTLAVSFALYGLVHKLAPLAAVEGLAVESSVLLAPAAGYLLWCEFQGTGAFLHGGWSQDVLLILGGPVTAVPLALFAAGAQRVPMTLLGVLQYISPTVALVIGVVLQGESFGSVRVVGFVLIWVALAVFTLDGWKRYRRARSTQNT